MRITRIGKAAYPLALLAAFVAPGCAQSAPNYAHKPLRPDLSVDYSYLHSNAPAGGCGCFSLSGGSVTLAWPLGSGHLAAVGDITAVHGGAISSGGYGLTLSSYTAGLRYQPLLNRRSLQPFGQLLLGVAHSGGSLVQGQYSPASNAAAAFAANFGGGLDLPINRRVSLRLVEADYLVTSIDNGSNNHQNNLRISMGALVHF